MRAVLAETFDEVRSVFKVKDAQALNSSGTGDPAKWDQKVEKHVQLMALIEKVTGVIMVGRRRGTVLLRSSERSILSLRARLIKALKATAVLSRTASKLWRVRWLRARSRPLSLWLG